MCGVACEVVMCRLNQAKTSALFSYAVYGKAQILRRDMDENLTPAELDWLQRLHTDEPVKPAPPAAIANRLLTLGLAIELAEGGMQLTDLGRDRLRSPTDNSSSR